MDKDTWICSVKRIWIYLIFRHVVCIHSPNTRDSSYSRDIRRAGCSCHRDEYYRISDESPTFMGGINCNNRFNACNCRVFYVSDRAGPGRPKVIVILLEELEGIYSNFLM
jgi:hypothetical protein